MLTPRLNTKPAAPWWAVLAAPALGVPLIIVLLAVAGGERRMESGADATARVLMETDAVPAAVHAPAEPAAPEAAGAVTLKRC